MQTNTALQADQQLDQLAGQFDHGRQHRSHPGEGIPQPLWGQAATLAPLLPYTRVAKHLYFSARALKAHMAETPGAPSPHAHQAKHTQEAPMAL
jgi:hypothetical protein